MKISNLTILIIGMVIIVLVSCQPDKPGEKIEFPVEEFVVKSNSDTTLFGKQGTRIFIGSETFHFPNGELVSDSIKVQLKEFYKKSDIALAGLSTESNGIILETGGMINIKAFSQGRKIEVRPEKRLVIHFPKDTRDFKEMNLFYADQTATDTLVTNWEIDTVSLVKETIQILSWGYYWLNQRDSTPVNSKPKNFVDTGYYWNPLELYANRFAFSESTIKEINNYTSDYYVGAEFDILKSGKIRNPIIKSRISKKAKSELLEFILGIPELTPSKDKFGNDVKRRAILGLSKGQIIPLYKTNEEYVRAFDSKYSKYENTPIRNMNDAELNYYIFSVGKLGWINCDRFMEFEEKVDLLVNLKESPGLKLKLVFNDINGVLMSQTKDSKYFFKQVPIGQKATIIGIRNADNELVAAIEEITISDSPIENLNFSEISLRELRRKLDEI